MGAGHEIAIASVEAGSPADEMGLSRGDVCYNLNGHPLTDFLDFQFYTDPDGPNTLLVKKKSGDLWEVEFELGEGEDLGIRWGAIRPRTCRNRCVFCFVDQMPRGVRPTLRVKDEDYRHSFLHGNFITLSNVDDGDIARILEQRLSPLYISVHTLNPALRRKMVRCRRGDKFFEYFRALADGGIRMHAQVVVVPGVNDGAEMEATVLELASYRPAVESVGLVPVGLTEHRVGLPGLKPPDPAFCRGVLDRVRPLQARWREQSGEYFVHAADEFYLQGGRRVPTAVDYDGFPQTGNGIGMVRRFLDDFNGAIRTPQRSVRVGSALLVTGPLFATTLRKCADRWNRKFGTDLRVKAAPNRFLGPGITVAGLLSGRDIVRAVEGDDPGEFVGISRDCLCGAGDLFLDDMTLGEVRGLIGVPVIPMGGMARWKAVMKAGATAFDG